VSNISKTILDRFIEEISEHSEIEDHKVKLLKDILEQGKKPKPKEIEAIFESVQADVQ